MRTLMKIFLAVMMLAALLGPAQAATDILYFNDYSVGTDRMGEALGGLGAGYSVTTVTSSSDFATQIASGAYDLGIFMVQDYQSSTYADGITALGAFVAEGGRSIYTDWSINNTYAGLFGAAWTGSLNESPVQVAFPPLEFWLQNPVYLTNPGWGTYSMGVSGATVAATFPSTDGAIVLGNSGRSITNGFLTDTFVDGPSGVQLYINEIHYLTNPVPVPGAIWLLGSGLLGLGALRPLRLIRKR